jgi:NTE family protein
MNKIGYVLSGGGARGIAHLGVLKFLEELNIKPYAIAGTSAGAVAGVLYAAGKKPKEILTLMKSNNYFGWSNIAWLGDGIFSMDTLRGILSDVVDSDDFDELKIKLFVAATDLVKGESVIFSKGKLSDAVIASASVPIVFEPLKMGNRLLVDGGILNNFPVEPLTNICDVIIGSYVNKVEAKESQASLSNIYDILDRCYHLAIANSVYSKVNRCDVFIEVPLHDYDMYDVKNADKIFELGYETAALHRKKLEGLAKQNLELA